MTRLSAAAAATRPRSSTRSRTRGRLARAALSAAAAAVLVSCGSAGSDSSDDTRRSSSPPASASPSGTPSAAATSPSPSPDPTLPDPADGTKTELCRDGRCEVRVTRGATLPVPERTGVGQLQVTSIEDRTVTLTAPMIQSRYSSDGGCEMGVTGPSADSPGFLAMTCESGAKGVVNKLRVQVVAVVGKAAVLRIGIAAPGADT